MRAYQLLAASSPDSPTNGPGEKSFTTALCDSLEELLRESNGESFPVVKLEERINSKRTAQASLIWDRLGRYKRNVKLGRLEPNLKRHASFQKAEPERAALVLRFSLKTNDMDDKQIEELARQMPAACKEAGVLVRRVEWVKLEQSSPIQVFRKVVKTVIRRKSKQGTPQQSTSPTPKKRTRSETSSLSTAKRQARENSSTPGYTTGSERCPTSS